MKTVTCTCGSTFADLNGLQQHAKSKNKSLRCSCRTLFSNRNKLVEHAQRHGHRITHEEKGGKSTASEEPLQVSDLQCPHCPKKKPFHSAEALDQHTEALHSETVLRNAKMQANQCPLCDNKFFRTAKDVMAHVKDVHGPSSTRTEAPIASRTRSKTPATRSGAGDVARKPHPCMTCGRRFQKAEYLEQHQAVKHPRERTVTVADGEADVFASSSTGPSSSITSSISAEMALSSNSSDEAVEEQRSGDAAAETPYFCPTYGLRFSSEALLEQHMIWTHSEAVSTPAVKDDASTSSSAASVFPYRTLPTDKATTSSHRSMAAAEASLPSSTSKGVAKEKKRAGPTKKKPHFCAPCSRRFKEAADLQRHNESTHAESGNIDGANANISTSAACPTWTDAEWEEYHASLEEAYDRDGRGEPEQETSL